jgi:hypothetical protein
MSLALFTLVLLAAPADPPDLEGRVVTTGGEAVTNAHVLIDSAGVRRGTSPLCPSCYLDCRKSAVTDKQGRFRIAALDPELLFNVLVVADGFRPTFARKSDPAKGPIEVALTPFDPDSFDPKRILRGVVLGPDDEPLVGASVTAQGFSTDAFSGFGPDIFDPVSVTNLRGEFVLTSKSPIQFADLRVKGNGVAPRIVAGRKPEGNPHKIKLTAGATLTGRLLRDGKPVAGAGVGLVQANRDASTFLGESSIGTDENGRFTFLNVHADSDYFVYGLMGSLKDGGAVVARRNHVGAEGATTDVGDLPVVPGHRLKGRVLLSDDKPVPPKTRLLVSREDAWDSQRVELDPEGRFELTGLPTERYSLTVMLKGYRISPKNHSSDSRNPWALVGTIDQDIDSLKILLEPGAN